MMEETKKVSNIKRMLFLEYICVLFTLIFQLYDSYHTRSCNDFFCDEDYFYFLVYTPAFWVGFVILPIVISIMTFVLKMSIKRKIIFIILGLVPLIVIVIMGLYNHYN